MIQTIVLFADSIIISCSKVLKNDEEHEIVIIKKPDAKGLNVIETCKYDCGYKKTTHYDNLVNTSTISADKVNIGQKVRITGKATGGTDEKTFTFYFKRSINKNWNKIGNGIAASITPLAAADFDIKVVATDTNGTIAEKIMKFTAVDPDAFVNTSTISAPSPVIGSTIRLTGSSENGKGKVKYAYYFRRKGNENYKQLTEKSGSAAVRPNDKGTYEFKVTAVDSAGQTAEKMFEVEVFGSVPFLNGSYIYIADVHNQVWDMRKIRSGTQLSILGSSTGGKGKITYEFFVKRASSNTWGELFTRGSGNFATVTLEAATTYEIKMLATDETGLEAEKIIRVVVYK